MRKLIAGTVAAVALTGAALAVASAPAGASSVPACGNHSLAVSHSRTDGATGHANVIIRFQNTGYGACSLKGYPGLDAVRANGTVLAHATRTLNGFTGGAHHIKTIVIQPGKYASADVEWMNFNPTTGGNCAFSKTIATTPANTSDTVHFKVSVSKCSLQVHPTVAGRTGNA